MDGSIIAYIVSIGSAIIGSVWSLAWWFARQFTLIRNMIYETREAILNKLEYHERHDDSRFEAVRKDIWEIRLRNAGIDASAIERERNKAKAKEI